MKMHSETIQKLNETNNTIFRPTSSLDEKEITVTDYLAKTVQMRIPTHFMDVRKEEALHLRPLLSS